MSRISNIYAREILNSQGLPTLEVEVLTEDGIMGKASVPNGVTEGVFESVDLYDNDAGRYFGRGVQNAVKNINTTIQEELNGQYIVQQGNLDAIMIELDGSRNKANLGSNAIFAVSVACARAAAQITGQPLFRYLGGINANTLPIPLINLISGGKLVGNKLDFNEFLILPSCAQGFAESLRIGAEIYQNFKQIIVEKSTIIGINSDGSLIPDLKSNEDALEMIIKAIEKSGFKAGEDIPLAINVAGTQLFDIDKNLYITEASKKGFTFEQMHKYLKKILKAYPIVSVEDPFHFNDIESWQLFNSEYGNDYQVVGNEIFGSNVDRIIGGLEAGVANSITIKPNRIGTVTETINTIEFALRYGIKPILTSELGETDDSFIADLSTAMNCGLIKCGAPAHYQNMSKFNQILRNEEILGGAGRFWGKDFMFCR